MQTDSRGKGTPCSNKGVIIQKKRVGYPNFAFHLPQWSNLKIKWVKRSIFSNILETKKIVYFANFLRKLLKV